MRPQTGTTTGRVEGTVVNDVANYLGIPYAARPTVPRRFGPLEPPAPWHGVREAVHFGPTPAAPSLGMSRLRTMRRVVLRQAMRVIIPPTGNETIGMLKTTALVSIVAVADLLYSAQAIAATTFQTIPLLIAASIWYIAFTTILSFGQSFLARRFSRGATRSEQLGLAARLRSALVPGHAAGRRT